MKEIKVARDSEKRRRQPWYLEFASPRGKKWLEKAMQDDAFRLGLGAKVRLSCHSSPSHSFELIVSLSSSVSYALSPHCLDLFLAVTYLKVRRICLG